MEHQLAEGAEFILNPASLGLGEPMVDMDKMFSHIRL